MHDHSTEGGTISGRVKWFDPIRSFGFVAPDGSGPDILLHANVLRSFGRSAVAEGSAVTVEVRPTRRGLQAVAVLSIEAPDVQPGSSLPDLAGLDPGLFARLPVEPARVKWFDKAKGFGFANLWRSEEDVFVHIEVLRRSGFADLAPGEAVALRVIDGKRGRMAVEVLAWDAANRGEPASSRVPGR